jgi:flagellum-specific ATP synthase
LTQVDDQPRISTKFSAALRSLAEIEEYDVFGRVVAVRGLLIEIAGPIAAMRLGGRVDIEIDKGALVPCEIIGFSGDRALAMPFGLLDGVRRG